MRITGSHLFASRSSGLQVSAALLRGLTLFHRWVGVVMCAFFAVWFATGAMMVFVAFPALPATDKASHAQTLDLARLKISPTQAAKAVETGADIRLVSRLGAPVYVVRVSGSQDSVLSGETGQSLAAVSPAQAGQIASIFGGAPARRVSSPFDYDQWVVHQQFDPLRPFYRVDLADGRGGQYYVSARTGEVVQRTWAYERVCNWLGSVIHWIYLTPIRRTFALWDWLVWSIALLGLSTTIAGIWLGVTRTRANLASKRPSVSPFRGLLRWHHILGLAAGAFVLCWITSGWLSMDHGRLFSRGEPSAAQGAAYRGPADPSDAAFAAADLARLTPSNNVSFSRIAGHAVASGVGPSGPHVLITGLSGPHLANRAPEDLIRKAVNAAWPSPRPVMIEPVQVDSPYAKAESLPPQALLIQPSGYGRMRIYVDGASGRILVVMNTSREIYAWVYYMLHTYNFPGLSSRPILRIILLLTPLTLGFVFSVTALMTGIRRIRLAARV